MLHGAIYRCGIPKSRALIVSAGMWVMLEKAECHRGPDISAHASCSHFNQSAAWDSRAKESFNEQTSEQRPVINLISHKHSFQFRMVKSIDECKERGKIEGTSQNLYHVQF